jgi:DNA/RNA-binding domain of Phe-tRNA-synthetase-like protein
MAAAAPSRVCPSSTLAERMQVGASFAWRQAYPGAHVGALLLEEVSNTAPTPALTAALASIERDLRATFGAADRATLLAQPQLAAYQRHYRAFGQTYHVLRQLESVALKGRPLSSPGGGLVSAMFGAELESGLLTAGHDADALAGDLLVDCAGEGDRFVGIGGSERTARPGDMLIRDGRGIISAVLDGPDERTRLGPSTRRALFVTYAPAGIEAAAVRAHLERLAELVRLTATGARTAQLTLVPD